MSSRWGPCPNQIDVSDLRGRIAVIGEKTNDDLHQSVVGEVPGVVLHANYIEALVDDRFFVPLDGEISVMLITALSGVIYLLFSSDVCAAYSGARFGGAGGCASELRC